MVIGRTIEKTGSPDSDLENIPNAVSEAERALETGRDFINRNRAEVNKKYPEGIQNKFLELAGEVEMESKQLENLLYALEVADQKLPKKVEEQGRNLRSTYEKRNSTEDKELVQRKLNPSLQQAIYIVWSAFKNRKYPAAIAGSTSFVLNLDEATDKRPGDIDAYGIVQDFPGVYAELKNDSKVTELAIKPTKNMGGKKNRGFELSGYVKTGENEDGREQFSIFFQSGNPGEDKNGRVTNLGREDKHFYEFTVNGLNENEVADDVCFADKEGDVTGNLRSILWEFALTDFQFYKDSKRHGVGVTAKFLQRISNLMALLHVPEERNFDEVVDLLEQEAQSSGVPEFMLVVDGVKSLRADFKNVPTHTKDDPSLTDRICKDNNVESHFREKALDIMTKYINVKMQEVLDLVSETEMVFNTKENEINNFDKLKKVRENFAKIKNIYGHYRNELNYVNKEDDRDFAPYMTLRALRDRFIWQAVNQVLGYYNQLKRNLEN